MAENRHRIAFGYHLRDWEYGIGSVSHLKEKANPITPEEYLPAMKGAIFCPECYTPLSRAPSEAELFTNRRTAHFRHQPLYKEVKCSLRVARAVGLNYRSEEEAMQAVQREDLVLVSGWMDAPPELVKGDLDESSNFSQTQIEDPNGPPTEMPLGRHTGKKVFLPTRISSVLALCRNFDKNLFRAFYFPSSQYAMYLNDILLDISVINTPLADRENLFFGKIVGYRRLEFRNIIYVRTSCMAEVKIYTYPSYDERKRICLESIGKTILFYSKLENEGGETVLRCFMNKWGQYSLLPEQYEKFLPSR